MAPSIAGPSITPALMSSTLPTHGAHTPGAPRFLALDLRPPVLPTLFHFNVEIQGENWVSWLFNTLFVLHAVEECARGRQSWEWGKAKAWSSPHNSFLSLTFPLEFLFPVTKPPGCVPLCATGRGQYKCTCSRTISEGKYPSDWAQWCELRTYWQPSPSTPQTYHCRSLLGVTSRLIAGCGAATDI